MLNISNKRIYVYPNRYSCVLRRANQLSFYRLINEKIQNIPFAIFTTGAYLNILNNLNDLAYEHTLTDNEIGELKQFLC